MSFLREHRAALPYGPSHNHKQLLAELVENQATFAPRIAKQELSNCCKE